MFSQLHPLVDPIRDVEFPPVEDQAEDFAARFLDLLLGPHSHLPAGFSGGEHHDYAVHLAPKDPGLRETQDGRAVQDNVVELLPHGLEKLEKRLGLEKAHRGGMAGPGVTT
jgi:hypothetical protein